MEINSVDKKLFTDIYLHYCPLMKKIAYDICGEYSVTDDLVNEAFIKIYGKIPIIKSLKDCQRTSYLISTIKNVSLNYVRNRNISSNKVLLGFSDDYVASIPENGLSIEDLYSIKEMINELISEKSSLSKKDQNYYILNTIMS